MKAIGLYLLSAVLFVAQMGIGGAACLCGPPAPSASNCPMTQVAGCKCCSESTQKKGAPEVGQPKKECGIRSSAGEPIVGAKAALQLSLPLILPTLPAFETAITDLDHPVPVHFVVHRIRPPEVGDHGLRAPPVW